MGGIKIETKFDKDTALAKISTIIKTYFEHVGRNMIEDNEIAKEELIYDIENILNQTNISAKHLIIERLEIDSEIKEELKHKWKI
jgi:hypothetical protein